VLPEAVELILLAVAALGFALVFAPAVIPRRSLAIQGGAGLVAGAAMALVPTFDVALLVLLALGAIDAAAGGAQRFALRLRAPAIAVAFLALALIFARVEGPDILGRFAAVGLVAGLAAAVGLLPYIHPFDADDASPASPLVWMAFAGPLLGVVIVFRAQSVLTVDSGQAFAAMLIGVGLLNMGWGAFASWLTSSTDAAWRYSFIADWGLVLCGFGLTVIDGQRGAMLALFAIIAGRLPLYLASRSAPAPATLPERPLNLVIAAALAGSAPFVGFSARVLILKGATTLYWPLAVALAIVMLLWLPGSLRLGRSLAVSRGRQAIGVALVLTINVVVGLYPLPLLAAAGL
jgi:hypothetical protein